MSKTDNAGLIRRLLCILYDCFLLLALLIIASAGAIALNEGNAIEPGHPYYPLYIVMLLAVAFIFYGWFWTHGGQTLGMKTWKIKLVSDNGERFTWKQSATRYVVALLSWGCAGTGFLWSLIDDDRRCWHDIASRSRLADLRQAKPD